MSGPPPPLKLGKPPPEITPPRTSLKIGIKAAEIPRYPPSGEVPDDEIHTNMTKKNEAGHNAYGSKLFLLKKRDQDVPYGIRKFTTLDNPTHVFRDAVLNTKKEANNYKYIIKTFTDKGQNYRDYVMPFLRFKDGGRWAYIDFEFIKGFDLLEYINRFKPSILEIRAILSKVSEALAALIAIGITHGDIKAENIFIREADTKPLLLDFADADKNPNSIRIQEDFEAFLHLCSELRIPAALVAIEIPDDKNSALNAYTEVARRLRGGKHMRQGGARKRLTRRKNRRRN